MAAEPGKTWVLTGSVDNFHTTRELGFRLIGMKERRRRMAETMRPGDEIVFYLTVVQSFAGIIRLTSGMFEDWSKVWPGKPGNPDSYPWRFHSEPVAVLDDDEFVPAVELVAGLEHVHKWPIEHWHLAFQGQLRTVGPADAALLGGAIRAAATATATTA
jgi:hypothetical protein